MKLLVLSSHADTFNSIRPEAEIFIGLQKLGVDVTVMTQADGVYNEEMKAAGINLIDFVPAGKFDRNGVRFVRDYVIQNDIDVVYAFNNPAIITCNRALRGLKSVAFMTYRGQTGNINRWDPTCYLTHLNPRVDMVLGVSDAVTRSVRAQQWSAGKAETVYKGHSLDWYNATPVDLQQLGIPEGAFVVGCVANNRPRKGVPVLIKAACDLPDSVPLHIVLVGSNMDEPELQKMIAKSAHPERFHVLGFRKDAPAVIAACDVSVLPSVKREGLPKTVIEAMVYGVTPVVTTAGGSPELVEDGVSGFIVPVNDPAAITEKLQWLYEHQDECKQMGERARVRIGEAFNVRNSAERTKDIMEVLVERVRA